MATFLSAQTTTTTTSTQNLTGNSRIWECYITGTGDVGAALTIEESLDGTGFVVLAEVALTGSGGASKFVTTNDAASGLRVKLWSISGTSAAVTVLTNT